jgi:geranylgeranyl diphosphate synthase, type I
MSCRTQTETTVAMPNNPQTFDEALEQLARRVMLHIEAFLPRVASPEMIARLAGIPTADLPPDGFDHMIATPVWDMLDRNGKCWRPIFAILLLEALGCEARPYEALIAVAELCHSGTLIIDDIQDAARVRRGDTSIHLRYGAGTAINAANLLYFLPWLRVDEDALLDDAQKRDIFSVMTRQFVRAHLGQTQDLFWSREVNAGRIPTGADSDALHLQILQMYAFKTGAFIEGLAETAAIVARCGKPVREACAAFARAAGVAYQIADDVVDYDTANSARKGFGADLREGKLTYVLGRALTSLPTADAARLRAIVTQTSLRTQAGACREAIDLVTRGGILDACRREAFAMIDPPWRQLAPALVAGPARDMLQELVHRLLQQRLDRPDR